jgi:hypothetical protein
VPVVVVEQVAQQAGQAFDPALQLPHARVQRLVP